MALRKYQRESVDAAWEWLRKNKVGNPAIVLPTGAGKTHVISEICRQAVQDWGGRVLVLAHVKELVQQACEKLQASVPNIAVGVYSAGLNRRDLGCDVTVAGIQSVYRRADELGKIDLILVDEAHMIPIDGDGMYRQLIDEITNATPHCRVIGLTATPYRMKDGEICGAENVLNEVCFEVGVRELIADKYLSNLRSRSGAAIVDLGGVKIRGGEFASEDLEIRMRNTDLVTATCADIVRLSESRKSVLIFSSGVSHGSEIVATLADNHGVECGFITGDTHPDDRAAIIADFKSGKMKYLANVNVLTTGFDAPNVDCVALVRPTMSPGLYYQMVGRGFRLAEGKTDCLVLDYGENVLRHGPVDNIQVKKKGGNGDGEPPAKECPACKALIATGYAVCPECNHVFPTRELKHANASSGDSVLSDGKKNRKVFAVLETRYNVHRKANGDGPPTMRVDYDCGFMSKSSEWICIEHQGYAKKKAESWWSRRSRDRFPESVEEAVMMANAGGLAETKEITTEQEAGEKFQRIVGHVLGDVPPRVEDSDGIPPQKEGEYYGGTTFIDPEEIPF